MLAHASMAHVGISFASALRASWQANCAATVDENEMEEQIHAPGARLEGWQDGRQPECVPAQLRMPYVQRRGCATCAASGKLHAVSVGITPSPPPRLPVKLSARRDPCLADEAVLLTAFRDSMQQNFGDHGLGCALASLQGAPPASTSQPLCSAPAPPLGMTKLLPAPAPPTPCRSQVLQPSVQPGGGALQPGRVPAGACCRECTA